MGDMADFYREQEEDDLEQIELHELGQCEFDRCPVCIAESCLCSDCRDAEPPDAWLMGGAGW